MKHLVLLFADRATFCFVGDIRVILASA